MVQSVRRVFMLGALALSLALGVAGAMIPMPISGCGGIPGPCIVVH